VLKEHPEIPLVQVEGHTDDRGSAEKNRALSASRANSVRDYLIKKGVPPEELRATGFGPDRPAADNATSAGREANRRVEFNIPDAEAGEEKR
jgi:OOP family OmpA-OmpF porin